MFYFGDVLADVGVQACATVALGRDAEAQTDMGLRLTEEQFLEVPTPMSAPAASAVDVAGRCSVCAAREAQRSLVRPGAKVSVLSPFLSGDTCAVVVAEGSTGVVVSIDADGDARIKLALLERVVSVFDYDVHNLRVVAGHDG